MALDVKSVDNPLKSSVGIQVYNGEPKIYRYSPWRASIVGFKKSFSVVRQIYASLRGVITGRISAKNFSGPVGIFKLSFRVAAQGPVKLLFWLAILSTNFAVFNMVPLPPFDGGLLVINVIEKIRRKPIPEKALIVAQTAGWVLVLVLMVLITINDIGR